MKTVFINLISGFFTVYSSVAQPVPAGIPATPKRPVTDTYFGKTVVDNYRWLEDT